MQGPGCNQAGDEFSAEQLCAMRRLRWAPLQSANAGSSLQREINRRRNGDDDRGSGAIFRSSSKNRAGAFAARRYRSWLPQTGAAEPDLERRRSATTQARNAIETRGKPCAKRTVAQDAQTEVDTLSSRGTDDRSAHGRRGTVAQCTASAR